MSDDFYNPQPGSAPGRFGVTAACTHCGVCVLIAPEHFGGGDSEWKIPAFIKRQPATPDEVSRCLEAKATCPCDAITDAG